MGCVNCGTQNAVDAKFCAECGTPLSRTCPSCSEPVAIGAKFCSDCGEALAPH
ncbi:MAG: double zinc ribbon domain-containing protein [Gaiella sp.]